MTHQRPHLTRLSNLPCRPAPLAKRAAPFCEFLPPRRQRQFHFAPHRRQPGRGRSSRRPTGGPTSWRSAGSPRSRRASFSASARVVPRATLRVASPMAIASSAPTARPVSSMSSARPWPTMRGRRTVVPSLIGTPQRRENTPNTAVSSTMRMSQNSATPEPAGAGMALDGGDHGLRRAARATARRRCRPTGSSRCRRPAPSGRRRRRTRRPRRSAPRRALRHRPRMPSGHRPGRAPPRCRARSSTSDD